MHPDPAPSQGERWTIKNKRGRTRYHGMQAVAGPYTDWVEVVPAADLDRLVAVLDRFLSAWDEFDGPPLTPQDTFNAIAESVESLRSALDGLDRGDE